MNFQFAPPDKVVFKDDNVKHFVNLLVCIFLISTQILELNTMKFDLNVSIKVRFIANDLCV